MTSNLKTLPLFRAAALAGLSFTAVSCETGPPYPADGNVFITDKPPRYGYQGTNSPNAGPGGRTSQNKPRNVGEDPSRLHDPNDNNSRNSERRTADTDPSPSGNSTPSDPNPSSQGSTTDNNPGSTPEPKATKPSSSSSLPFGTPVIGRKGFVYSPYAPDKGMVDVVDVPPNTKVECPYTGKPFRVP